MPHPVDLAARVLADVAPRRFTPRIDQVRLDARAVLGRLGGREAEPLVTADPNVPPLEEVALLDVLPRGIANRVRGVGRDLTMVARQLRGRRPQHLVTRQERAPAAPRPPKRAHADENRATITRRVQETSRAVSLYLEGALLDATPPRAGQFLTVEAELGGRVVRRCYSFASAEGDAPFITIKRVNDGAMSTFLTTQVTEGARLKVLPAGGFFTLDAVAESLVFIAGGSGITPIVSLIETALREGHPRVHLIYGNHSQEDTIFRERITALSETHRERFTVTWFVENGASGNAREGRPTEAALTRELNALALEPSTAFICGPDPMREAAERALAAAGVHDVRTERFAIAEAGRVVATDAVVTFDVGGREVIAESAGETLLEIGERAGLTLPFSCAMGGCGTCRLKVEGDVVMDEPNALTDEERREGYVLTCVSRACGPVRVKL